MFARAPKRTLYCDAYRQSSSNFEFLNLPFLCPALFRRPNGAFKDSHAVRAASSKSHLWRTYIKGGRNPASRISSNRRKLASAAAAIQYEHEPEPGLEPDLDNFVPWAGSSRVTTFDGAGISAVPSFDPSTSLLVFRNTLTTYPKKFRAKESITGDLNELHQNLHACLQVGRLERAAALLRRLNQIYNPDAAGLLAAHSDYVREVTNKIVQTQDQRLLKDLQRWFEVDLKRVGVIPNAEIYAQMIRASSQSPRESRERAVRRYLKIADEAGFGVETRALWESDIEDSAPVCICACYRIAC